MSQSIDFKLTFFERFKAINETYFDRFKSIASAYEEIINSGPAIRPIAFTPHCYKHCNNVFKIAEMILPESFYNQRGDNIFVLAISILFHDLAMAYDGTMEARFKHSTLSAELVKKEMLSKANTVLKSFLPDKNMRGHITDIIAAHSDTKSDTGSIICKTFVELIDKYDSKRKHPTRGNYEEINVPFLAAILRIADELDIDGNRVKDTGHESKNMSDESREHHLLCELFSVPILKKDKPTYISLKVDDDKFDELTEDKKIQAAVSIIARFEKIKSEFKILRDRVFINANWTLPDWKYEEIELDDEQCYRCWMAKKKVLVEDKVCDDKEGEHKIGDYLTTIVKKNSLFLSGHFMAGNSLRVRDWVCTESLFTLSDNIFINKVAEVIHKTMKNNGLSTPNDPPCFLIGIDMLGGVLASRVGYINNCPFTYYYDEEKSKFLNELERNVNLIEVTKLVLLVDVIVLGTTLRTVINELIGKKIISEKTEIYVISLFERTPKNYGVSEIYTNRFIKKAFVLNDFFDIEVCSKNKDECIFRKENLNKYQNKLKT